MAELDRAAISVRLGQARDQAGIKQTELADALQRDGEPLHFRTVQNYESPKNPRVPWDLLDQWATITGTTKEWLLHGDDLTPELPPLQELQEALAKEVGRLEKLNDQLEARLAEQAGPRRTRKPA
jgi:transcriptional regulator with XRE-family HTH domain